MPTHIISELQGDSPQHKIKTLNLRKLNDPGVPDQVSARTAKSDEDGQLMYVVIKPAPVKATVAPKKYRAENQEIYMSGVQRSPRLNLAPGAYPVFYSIAAANGKFGRNIRALTKEEISLAEKAALNVVQE